MLTLKCLGMKKYYIALFLSLYTISGYAQTVKDYFFKQDYSFIAEGRRWFTDKAVNVATATTKDSQYEYILSNDETKLKRTYLIDEGGWYSNWKTLSTEVHLLQCEEDAIYSVSQEYNNALNHKVCKDKIILVAIPEPNEPRKWKEKNNGDEYDCAAEWTYLSNNDQVYKTIKISKRLIAPKSSLDGTVEISYWAEGEGLVILKHALNGYDKIDSYRINFESFSEISEEQYQKLNAWYKFSEEQDNYLYALKAMNEPAYYLMESEFAFSIMGCYKSRHFVFDYFDKYESQDWPSTNIEHESIVYLRNNAVDTDRSTGEPDGWYEDAYSKVKHTAGFEYPTLTEPISGMKYQCRLKDQYHVSESIKSYVLTFKKSKDGYVLKKGDEETWNLCKEQLQPYIKAAKSQQYDVLDQIITPAQLRIIKSECCGHTAYYVVTETSVSYDRIYCKSDFILFK